MIQRICGAILVALLVAAFDSGVANSDTPPTEIGWSLKLRYGDAITLSASDIQPLYAKSIEIVASSNFNSRTPRWKWDLSEILGGYQSAIAGNHLLLRFTQPQRITTVGGEIQVREILIGLNGPQYASSLHTVDEEGRIVGHAKYAGHLCVELLELVKSME